MDASFAPTTAPTRESIVREIARLVDDSYAPVDLEDGSAIQAIFEAIRAQLVSAFLVAPVLP